MNAADVYATLGIDPLPAAGLAWSGLKPYERRRALLRHNLPTLFSARGWRDLPAITRDALTDAHRAN